MVSRCKSSYMMSREPKESVMPEHQHLSHLHDGNDRTADHGTTVLDPVCGMKVDVDSTTRHYRLGETEYHFCSVHCLNKFKAGPENHLNSTRSDPVEIPAGTIWTC